MNRLLYVKTLGPRVSFGLLVLRVFAGSALMFHGWPKIQHAFNWMGPGAGTPVLLQSLAALSEFGGGLALILGLITPIAAIGITCTMAVAISTVHLPHHDPFVAPMGWKGHSWESAAGYFVIAVLLICTGAGRFSLDALLFGRSRR